VILSTNKGGQINISHLPNKAFQIQDSCRATVRDCNSISAGVTEDAIENYYNDTCFSYILTIWQVFWTF